LFSLLFRSCFVPVLGGGASVVSSLAYPNLLGNKRLGCCCCKIKHPKHNITAGDYHQ
jgi:hypothetical protein